MRLIFCGTPEFAMPTLERLVEAGHSIELVVTNPDEPAGRGYALKPPPIKEAATRHHLLIFQPAKFKEPTTRKFLSGFQPDAMVVAAYGHILPQWVLDLPRLGCINLHASLLPKYRGAAPIAWAIVRGERETGVTTMKIDAGMDTGDVLLEKTEPILDTDTAGTLSERLSVTGAELMVETLRGLESGEIVPRPQDARLATLAPMLKKEDGRIDWSSSAVEICRRIRGFDPWPGAFTDFHGKTLHIWKATPAGAAPSKSVPGTLVLDPSHLAVVCGEGSLLALEDVQAEGRKRMPGLDFARGARLHDGDKLGA